MSPSAIGLEIRRLRRRRRWTQEQLGARTDLSRVHISRLERGQRVPPLDTLCRIASALRVEPGALLNVAAADRVELEPNPTPPTGTAQPVADLTPTGPTVRVLALLTTSYSVNGVTGFVEKDKLYDVPLGAVDALGANVKIVGSSS